LASFCVRASLAPPATITETFKSLIRITFTTRRQALPRAWRHKFNVTPSQI
jgi:hypothetical protein